MANGTKLTKTEKKALKAIRAAERSGALIACGQATIDALWAKNLIRKAYHTGHFYCLEAGLRELGEVK